MKIAFLQNIDGIAGSEKYFLALIPALIKKGVTVEMITVIKKSNREKAQPFLDLLQQQNIPFKSIYVANYASPSIPFKLNRYLKKNNFSILHTHLIYADVWAGLLKFINHKIKIISTKHGYHEDTYVKYCTNPAAIPKNLYYYLFKFSHKKMDASYACSAGLKDFYTKANLIKPGEMDVILHGFNYPAIVMDDLVKYRFSELQIIITGRLIPRKGHHFLLEVMPRLIHDFPHLKLVILGTGPLAATLKEQVKQLNIQEHILFLGFQQNVNQFLKASDLMAVTSYSEGLPLVIFEAFNAKTPVVTFNAIGCNELVKHETTGLIATAFELDSLYENMKKLLTDAPLRKKISENAYQALNNDFSLERMRDETIAYYQKVLTT
ncbi:hypothetical protein DNU06_02160 [Putridiphycobacter roseus]|uniref:Glycosyltransferase n=1 Tax=Putridiphycobacter roseus TaxID=2219161 RepID=A0A2W1NGM8_9FLAO|nr:glycosyltransferase family 4 protein [Putridiphycobacter roseus]PZE18655.1 hypothetical protein DNU06_02160 [Putridiphycobacter roseus]